MYCTATSHSGERLLISAEFEILRISPDSLLPVCSVCVLSPGSVNGKLSKWLRRSHTTPFQQISSFTGLGRGEGRWGSKRDGKSEMLTCNRIVTKERWTMMDGLSFPRTTHPTFNKLFLRHPAAIETIQQAFIVWYYENCILRNSRSFQRTHIQNRVSLGPFFSHSCHVSHQDRVSACINAMHCWTSIIPQEDLGGDGSKRTEGISQLPLIGNSISLWSMTALTED